MAGKMEDTLVVVFQRYLEYLRCMMNFSMERHQMAEFESHPIASSRILDQSNLTRVFTSTPDLPGIT